MTDIGIGDRHAWMRVYTVNRPPMPEFSELDSVVPLLTGDIARISSTGNHWRKIFNVYAKLMWLLKPELVKSYASWQSYRDNELLQSGSGVSLLFSAPDFSRIDASVKLIMGKQYAEDSGFLNTGEVSWFDPDANGNGYLAQNKEGWVLCPYFDYRQLSNRKLGELADLILT